MNPSCKACSRWRLWLPLAVFGLVLSNCGETQSQRDSDRGKVIVSGDRALRLAEEYDVALVDSAFQNGLSGLEVTVQGAVIRLLADDASGDQHQRFILQLSNRQTLLVAHNIDIAERVPVQTGDTVLAHGQYEWNDKGGVLHWTHHDPESSHEAGWIEARGVRYQ